ncbi:TIGR04219 family outer membrane beta-barrel protein [Thalassotalea sp. LPB0316]|uniref:TIGR04219 family outer membrane beta-barrel protein n=1 Tax=Thalassotalea sp. LPB0316 TaxID=2769490 RepID=UPI0018677C74|nr:TIGR04219 family outer membrane beta-barrel protein [Thalassotalea sp. LPB0316]QOL25920.1 TIGR04219 family outer membrane beta-barrel protein [Thalassotalea sp. LPB0316]
MKKALIAASCAALLSTSAQADVLGIYIGGSVWDQKSSGEFGEQNNLVDFNFTNKKKGSYYIAFEHPIPLIPNVKIATSDLDTSGQTVLDEDFDFQGVSFPAGTTVDATFDLSFVDYTLYYEILDNGLVSLDLGLTGRDVDGFAGVVGTIATLSESAEEDFSGIVPMLYGAAKVGLPFTGLSLYGEANLLAFDDHTFYDAQAGIAYELVDNIAVDVNIFLGYRQVSLDIEDVDDLYADINFKGVYAGAEIHF